MKNPSDGIREAFLQAAQGIKRNFTEAGRMDDPDLQRYVGLRPDDFDEIRARYGMRNTVEYVQEMESRLMRFRGRK